MKLCGKWARPQDVALSTITKVRCIKKAASTWRPAETQKAAKDVSENYLQALAEPVFTRSQRQN
jgi:hypothetical protein